MPSLTARPVRRLQLGIDLLRTVRATRLGGAAPDPALVAQIGASARLAGGLPQLVAEVMSGYAMSEDLPWPSDVIGTWRSEIGTDGRPVGSCVAVRGASLDLAIARVAVPMVVPDRDGRASTALRLLSQLNDLVSTAPDTAAAAATVAAVDGVAEVHIGERGAALAVLHDGPTSLPTVVNALRSLGMAHGRLGAALRRDRQRWVITHLELARPTSPASRDFLRWLLLAASTSDRPAASDDLAAMASSVALPSSYVRDLITIARLHLRSLHTIPATVGAEPPGSPIPDPLGAVLGVSDLFAIARARSWTS